MYKKKKPNKQIFIRKTLYYIRYVHLKNQSKLCTIRYINLHHKKSKYTRTPYIHQIVSHVPNQIQFPYIHQVVLKNANYTQTNVYSLSCIKEAHLNRIFVEIIRL